MEYDRNTGQIATTFTPELSWGPATFKGAAVPGGVKITLELKLALSKDWSITIAQEYIFKKTITDAEAQRAVIEAVVDPFFEAVNGGQGNFSDLRALGGP
ncbi:MAG: hypothetical protein IPL61_06550 [Myxococcales bacterium]|nr:hypothetical protein [Myxococcales bacterium]